MYEYVEMEMLGDSLSRLARTTTLELGPETLKATFGAV